MSNVLIYVGDNTRSERLEAQGWLVFSTNDMMQALAMTVVYYPDLIVVDRAADTELANNTLMHLESINFEPVLVVDETVDTEELIQQIHTLLIPTNEPQRIPA